MEVDVTDYVYSLGVDPGPLPGVVGLLFVDNKLDTPDIIQCSANVCPWLVTMLLETTSGHGAIRTILAVEKFVIGGRSTRVSTPGASAKTRELLVELRAGASADGRYVVERSASEVKIWATDARLHKLGLLDATKGMTHARDAARHALFAACRDLGVPDPLSKRSQG
jgi:hypothetical protein